MSRMIFTGVLGMLLASCGTMPKPVPSAPAGHQAGEEAAVLAALDRYVSAIPANDLPGMAAMQMPDAWLPGSSYNFRFQDRRPS